MPHYDFFQNKQCEYFPCHKVSNTEDFNCLFCYCPLYALGRNCGGSFRFTNDGIKDCSLCLIPHKRENYALICDKMRDVISMVTEDALRHQP